MQEAILKWAAYCPEGTGPTRHALGPKWDAALSMASAGPDWVDFTVADKALGLTTLCRALGVSPAETAAFGDNWNDAPMLSLAARGYLLAASDPNLQNLPGRTEFGRQIRSCFVPLQAGELFLSADYSQIELRLLAHLSNDEHLVAAFCSGADFHAATASRVFGLPVEDVSPGLRSRAKAVNFGIVYGQQAFGLSQSLGIPFGEAKEMIERYFEAYPGVRAYLDRTIAEAKEKGYAETMFGRKRHIPELKAANATQRGFGERTAMNHPMQGSAADIIKLAMTEVQRRIMERGFEAKLLLQVHDELDFSVPEREIEELSAIVKDVMEHIVDLRVPLDVDVSCADNWAEAH